MEKRGHTHPGWLYVFPWQHLSLSFLHGDFVCEWKVERDIWTVGLQAAGTNQLIFVQDPG